MSEAEPIAGCPGCAALSERNAALERRVAVLEAQLAKLLGPPGGERGDGAAAAEGAKSKPPKKRPGRKPGRGRFSYRLAPSPEELSGPPVDVPLPATCDRCQGELEEVGQETLYLTELPECPKPIITAFVVHQALCRSCGRRLRSSHELLRDDQTGATAHRLGPRAAASALALHYEVGVPQRRVPRVMKLLRGLKVTQSAIAQEAKRQAQGAVGAAYEQIRSSVRTRSVVYTDDTGWKVSGQRAQLMAFDTDEETVYQVRAQHRNDEVREIVPSDYPGVLVSDRAPSYDAKELASVHKQKCLWHALRSIDEVLEQKQTRARSFGMSLASRFKAALALHARFRKGRISREHYDRAGLTIERQVDELLEERQLPDPDNQRLLDEFGWQHRAGNLLRFLHDPSIEPTNNRSERALKPPIMARKISQCSKNPLGAYAMSAFRSVIQTLKKRGLDVVEALVALFRGQTLASLHPT